MKRAMGDWSYARRLLRQNSCVFWFFLFYLPHHCNIWSLALAVMAMIMGSSLQEIGMCLAKLRADRELYRDARMHQGAISLVNVKDLKEVVPHELWHDIASTKMADSYLHSQNPEVRGIEAFVLAYQTNSAVLPWTPGSAFLAPLGARIVIVRDHPLSVRSAWSRFLLLHELAHVSSHGLFLHELHWWSVVMMVNTIVTAMLLSNLFSHPIEVSLLVGIVTWTLKRFLQFEVLCESTADSITFAALSSESERKRVLDLIDHEVVSSMNCFGPKHFHTRLWIRRRLSLDTPPRNSFVQPSVHETRYQYLRPHGAMALLMMTLGWSTAQVPEWRLWAYAMWCVGLPLCSALLFTVTQVSDSLLREKLDSTFHFD